MSNFGIIMILGFRVVTNHVENQTSESVSEIKTENLGFPRIGTLARKPNIGIGSRVSGDRASRVVTNHASR